MLMVFSMDEALAILPVSCEILFSDAIDKCIQYMDVVPWIPIQESMIWRLTSSLGIAFLPHLAARLATNKYKFYSEYLDTVKKILENMLTIMMSVFKSCLLEWESKEQHPYIEYICLWRHWTISRKQLVEYSVLRPRKKTISICKKNNTWDEDLLYNYHYSV